MLVRYINTLVCTCIYCWAPCVIQKSSRPRLIVFKTINSVINLKKLEFHKNLHGKKKRKIKFVFQWSSIDFLKSCYFWTKLLHVFSNINQKFIYILYSCNYGLNVLIFVCYYGTILLIWVVVVKLSWCQISHAYLIYL